MKTSLMDYNDNSMLDISQLSELLNVSKHTIYSWTSDRYSGIPVYRVKRSLRFRYGEIMAWLKKYRGSEGTKEFDC